MASKLKWTQRWLEKRLYGYGTATAAIASEVEEVAATRQITLQI